MADSVCCHLDDPVSVFVQQERVIPAGKQAVQVVGNGICVFSFPDFARLLRSYHHSFDKFMHVIIVRVNSVVHVRIVAFNFKGSFNTHTAIRFRDDGIGGIPDKPFERLKRRGVTRHFCFKCLYPDFGVVPDTADEELVLIPDRIVEAGDIDLHRLGKVTRCSSAIALFPENLHRFLNNFAFIELLIPRHGSKVMIILNQLI